MAPTYATFSDEEKNKVRYHMGYLVTLGAASIQLGFPRASQPMFLVDQALERVPEAAGGMVRRLIAVLDSTEERIIQSQRRLAADAVGEIKLRPDEPGQLEREYQRWAQRLADLLGAPLNAYSERFRNLASGGLNTPVVS